MKNLNVHSLNATRWGAGAAAAAMAMAVGVPSAQAQPAVEERVSAPAHATGVGAPGGFIGKKWGDELDDDGSKDVNGSYQAAMDPGSLFTVGKAIGARELWEKTDKARRSLTGQGLGIAVLDSGVSQVDGLNGTGKVTYGPDLSIEGNGVLTQQDTFGHGTYMAGIIAGRGTTLPSSALAAAAPDVQLGVAPDAKILAMKLATTDGSTDVSQVIAALDWVTQNPVMPDGTRIRVINLSYGTNSAQSYLADPLAAAAENAWRHGIVVVTSAGNNGSVDGRLTDPAIDPYVLAVGATDSNHRLDGWDADDSKVAAYSQVGSAARHADLVAPGTSLVSTRAPGSYIDINNPEGLVDGDASGKLFRGSGTSQAAAVVSGSVALLLQAYPTLTPDQVKSVLTSSADLVNNTDPRAGGAGTLDLTGAFYAAGAMSKSSRLSAAAVQSFPRSTGQGSIDAARGDSVLVDPDGADLIGEIDVQGNTWDPAAWWQASSSKTAWSGGKWLGNTWTGDSWEPDSSGGLTAIRWTSTRWTSTRWSDSAWS